jgi:hypothetical protein
MDPPIGCGIPPRRLVFALQYSFIDVANNRLTDRAKVARGAWLVADAGPKDGVAAPAALWLGCHSKRRANLTARVAACSLHRHHRRVLPGDAVGGERDPDSVAARLARTDRVAAWLTSTAGSAVRD